ncbi:MAG: IS4 family transposase, partial [Pseudomonadota bacterium]
YLGAGPLCGAQIRYLIISRSHGLLGGLSFSAASPRLKERDRWIGWSERARQQNLEKVVCNSRFLIADCVRVDNLASRVLHLALERLPSDWNERYGCEPVLVETFVDERRYPGTCYRAANWTQVGETAGREDGFRNGKKSSGKKRIYLYELKRGCKAILSKEPVEELAIRGSAADAKDWADEEFGGARFFDGRLRARLADLARDFFKRPGASIPEACEGSKAKARGAYRLFSNRRLGMKGLLKGHAESTLGRASKERVVLAVQDTTSLNYTAHSDTQGLGPINTKADSGTGLELHSTLCFSTKGTPLGLLDVQCWARDPEEAGKAQTRKHRPIDEKESIKWFNSYRRVAEAQRLCPNTMFVSTGDREADIHAFFVEAVKESSGPKVLVRANRACQRKVRVVNEAGEAKEESYDYLWDRLGSEPCAGTITIRIPRQGARPARDATLEIRFAKVQIRPPRDQRRLGPVDVWAVNAKETDYAASVKEPVDWMILTTVPTSTFEEACERIGWYATRWGIEVFHRALKSGVRIEDRQLDDAESIQRCLAVDLVVAWRIFWMTKLGRETPDASCSVFLEELEWQVLCAVIHQAPPPPMPPTAREAVRMIARLGGFLGRKSDGEPGTITVWRGLIAMQAMVVGARAALRLSARDTS